MAAATMDSFDAQMVDFSADNDIQMNLSEPWMSDMPMDADDDLAVVHRDTTSQEIEMSDHIQDTEEFEMLDGEGQGEDAELRDVEFEDASQAIAAELFAPEPAELEMSPPSQPSQTDPSHLAAPANETFSSIPTSHTQEDHSLRSDDPALAFTTASAQHPTHYEAHESSTGPSHDGSDPSADSSRAEQVEPSAEYSNAEEHSQQPEAPAVKSSDATDNATAYEPTEHLSEPSVVDEHRSELELHATATQEDDGGEAAFAAEPIDKPAADGDYRPTVLLSTPDLEYPHIYLFNAPTEASSEPVLLGTHPPTLYWSSLSDLFNELRQQEFVKRLPDIDIAELAIEAYDIRLTIAENDPATSSCSLHDFDMIHSNEGLPGYLRLRLTAPVPFIERFSRLKAKFEASLHQVDSFSGATEEGYADPSAAEEHADYEPEDTEQQEQPEASQEIPVTGSADVHDTGVTEEASYTDATPVPGNAAPFEDASVPAEASAMSDSLSQLSRPTLDADEVHGTADALATAETDNQATEFVEHADPYEEGDEGIEEQTYDDSVDQAEGATVDDGATIDFTVDEQQDELEYGQDLYDEGAYDEKLYGSEHVTQEASHGVPDVARLPENRAGNDGITGAEATPTADRQQNDAVVLDHYDEDSHATGDQDDTQLPPLPEDDGEDFDSELTAEGSTYQDPIVLHEPEAESSEGGTGVEGEEYYEEGEVEEGSYEAYDEAEGEGDYPEAEYAQGVEGHAAGGQVAEAVPEQAAEGDAAHQQPSQNEEVEASGEAQEEGQEGSEGDHDAEGEDDDGEDGDGTFGLAEYDEADTTLEEHDVTLDEHDVTLDEHDVTLDEHDPALDIGEQLEVASNLSSTTLSSTSPVPKMLKSSIPKSSSKRSLREVDGDEDGEGASGGLDLSPGAKRARVEA
ncbi:hypothetical protein BD626DRAFT_508140 [Schizophyllum amplum]|uniref:Uncharacterized protein n=1 Tax=Schizophyllum amplum TaxID=97359 RepID=A0A550C3N4_9AGAR|nr:hypothetical protein BD626DRAFT_508140 [Auriculariopsis ampla]